VVDRDGAGDAMAKGPSCYLVFHAEEGFVGDILQFPARAVREWTVVEEEIRRQLVQNGADAGATDAILARIREVWLKFSRTFTVTIDLPMPAHSSAAERDQMSEAVNKTIAALTTQFHALTSEMLFDRVLVEIERYYLIAGK
jgi:hypothetical protein